MHSGTAAVAKSNAAIFGWSDMSPMHMPTAPLNQIVKRKIKLPPIEIFRSQAVGALRNSSLSESAMDTAHSGQTPAMSKPRRL